MTRTLEEAMAVCDERFRAMSGVPSGSEVVLRRPEVEFAPLFSGLVIPSQEGLAYSRACTAQTVKLVLAGAPLGDVTYGALLRALLVGLLVNG